MTKKELFNWLKRLPSKSHTPRKNSKKSAKDRLKKDLRRKHG